MPFIVRWPDKVEANSTCDQLICFTDLLATFAQMNDVQFPSDAGPDSFSFLPLLKGDDEPVRTSLVMRSGGGHMMVRKGDWKLINALGSGGFSQPKKVKPEPGQAAGQLYNLADDLGETNNLYQDKPEIVKSLTDELTRIQGNQTSRLAPPRRSTTE